MLTEGDSWPGGSVFDSQAGFMFRRLCPPVLGLPPHAELDDYVARRAELGRTEVSRRFLATGTSALCVDGFADAVRSALATRTAAAVGVKSIAAYRTGLDLGAERPADSEVATAAGRWLADAQPGTP